MVSIDDNIYIYIYIYIYIHLVEGITLYHSTHSITNITHTLFYYLNIILTYLFSS